MFHFLSVATKLSFNVNEQKRNSNHPLVIRFFSDALPPAGRQAGISKIQCSTPGFVSHRFVLSVRVRESEQKVWICNLYVIVLFSSVGVVEHFDNEDSRK